MDITSNDNKYVFELAWGPDIIETGTPTTFVMNLQDINGKLLSGSSFDFVLSQDGKEIYRQHMTSGTGDYSTKYTFSNAGTVTLTAANINGGGQGAIASINLIVQQGSNSSTPQTQQQQPSGCLIATAAFGSELTPQVQFLRNFRDQYILSTASGSAFMNAFNSIYYSFSPQVADYERGQPWLRTAVKGALYPLFGILMMAERVYASVAGDIGSILAGAASSSLIGAVYLWPAGLAVGKKISITATIVVAGATLTALAITLVELPALLPITTSAFVIAVAGISAILTAKAVRRAFKAK
jgi:peptide/nickel transport system substrate-binding protein